MKTWVTKYKCPETRLEIEHDEGECAACLVVGGIPDGAVCFVLMETLEGEIIRRVEGLGKGSGLHISEYGVAWTSEAKSLVGCKIVSKKDADKELDDLGWVRLS